MSRIRRDAQQRILFFTPSLLTVPSVDLFFDKPQVFNLWRCASKGKHIMPTWSPKTWSAGAVVTAADLNAELRDNLNTLKNPPSDHHDADEASNYTTTSTAWVDVDATDFNLTLDTSGGDVLVGFSGALQINDGNSRYVYLDVLVDSSPAAGDDGILGMGLGGSAERYPVAFVRLISGLSAGSHTFKLRWKVDNSSGTATLYAGAGTSNNDWHPQFWAREVS